MNKTGISYLTHTWNPTKGCSPASSGCNSCWAKAMSKRLAGNNVKGYDKDDPFKVTCFPDRLDQPLKVKKPSVIGASFMGDLFHKDVPFEFIDRVFANMACCVKYNKRSVLDHKFLILTKRPEIMAKYLSINDGKSRPWFNALVDRGLIRDLPWMPNVYLGVSVEDQKTADERIPLLLQIPAAKRFVSVEPMLDKIWLNYLHYDNTVEVDALKGSHGVLRPHEGKNAKLSWVIAGAESGGNRRPANIEWFRSLRDQCQSADVPYFLKQMEIDGKIVEMPILDGRVWDQMPGGE